MEKNVIENLISKEEKTIEGLKRTARLLTIPTAIVTFGSNILYRLAFPSNYIKKHLAEYNQNITTELTPLTSELNKEYNLELTPSANVLDQLNYYHDNMFQTHINKEQFYEIIPKSGLENLYAHFGEVKEQLQEAINNITYNFIDWSVVNNQIFCSSLFIAVATPIILYAPTILFYISSKRKISKLRKMCRKEQNEQTL